MNPRCSKEPTRVERTTLKSGAPVGCKLNSLLMGPRGPNLLADTAYLEEIAHFNRERIPERVVHAKGAAAFGHFELTKTDIGEYTRAAVFAGKPGKRTPAVARFSVVGGESGAADTARDLRGFAVKLYTDEGNWDLVGNNLPVFFIRDPINFASLIHSQRRNPRTHLRDPDAFWDFVSLLPESLHATMMLFADRGIPDGYRHMHGYGVNTFKLVNQQRQVSYAKFHWICDQPIRNLSAGEAARLAGHDADYATRDLYVNIERGNAPSWTLKFQVMSAEEAAKVSDFNPFDVTKTWPQSRFPLREIGRLTLERNAENYFAQVEQLAFSPANLVPGIEASPDRMLVGRMFAYPDAQRYRLGANYADLPVNQARCPVMTPTYCDGLACFASQPAPALPNYLPAAKYANLRLSDDHYVEEHQQFSGQIGRYDDSGDENYAQVRVFINRVLSPDARKRLALNIADHLKDVRDAHIAQRALRHLQVLSGDLLQLVEIKLNAYKSNKSHRNR